MSYKQYLLDIVHVMTEIEAKSVLDLLDIPQYEPEFEEFWNAYDKKVGSKDKISKKWNKLANRDKNLIMQYIPKYKNAVPDKQYRKNPETFLNNKSWNDELIFSDPTLRSRSSLMKL